ncbi:glycoside hydrolase family 43 protein [Allosphingosinicella sp.]|uniref:glycoside hydrolase family 43 protein n=1 Tax=Allosphingosinicella sp. TaxID=2823234 RepID=UPI002F0E3C27
MLDLRRLGKAALAAIFAQALLFGCTAPAERTSAPATYANPVLDEDFPDPAVIRAPDGYYYAYATQSEVGGAFQNIQAARSLDLVAWERIGDVLPVKPAWASRTQDYWAPHVAQHGGRYFLYYSAKPDSALADQSQGLCLAVATATGPQGPFTDIGRPLQCGPSFVNIDPMSFDDPRTGRRLLYWGSGFGPIKVQELAEDRISFAPGSSPVDLVHVRPSQDPADYQRLVEGAWVIYRAPYYYLFYSGDNCCGPNAHYAALVARSRSATGPFETMGEANGTGSSVMLAQRGIWVAPGHNSIIADERGDEWIVYHAVDSRRPRSRADAEVNTRRVMLIDRIEWRDGWPRVAGDGPSTGPQPRPRTGRRAGGR